MEAKKARTYMLAAFHFGLSPVQIRIYPRIRNILSDQSLEEK